MDPGTRIILETIESLGYRVEVAADHIKATHETTGETYIVRGDDIDRMADELFILIDD